MKLSIIIVSWNVVEKLRENLTELFKSQTNFQYEVFVVDNNSADNSADVVASEFLQVKLIKNKENLGFAKANNQAIEQTDSDYVLLLNPDMKVFSDTLENMVKWMDKNEQAGVAGCKLVNENGQLVKHVRKFPDIFDQLMIVLKIPHFVPSVVDDYLMESFNYEKAAKVDSIRGAFFMIRRNVLDKIPILDEQYFIWFEEVDYCKQVYKKGEQVWYSPDAKCIDYVGQSFSQVPKGRTQNYFMSSQLKYFKKWHNKFEYYLLRFAWYPTLFAMNKVYKK